MKKVVLLLFLLLFCVNSFLSAQSMRTLFVQMPDSIMPFLTKNNREDCVDFIDANMLARVTNRLDAKSELLQFTSDYLHLKTSEAGSMQMKMLPVDGDTILCVINTVCAEACDSRIAFYTRNWQLLDGSRYFRKPLIRDFFLDVNTPDSLQGSSNVSVDELTTTVKEAESLDELLDIADIYLVHLTFSDRGNILTAEYTMPHYMLQGDSLRVAPHLRKLSYRWTSRGFERE